MLKRASLDEDRVGVESNIGSDVVDDARRIAALAESQLRDVRDCALADRSAMPATAGVSPASPLGIQSSVALRALTRSKSKMRCRHRSSYGSTAMSAACNDHVGPFTDRRAGRESIAQRSRNIARRRPMCSIANSAARRSAIRCSSYTSTRVRQSQQRRSAASPTKSPISAVIQRERRARRCTLMVCDVHLSY